MLGCPEVGKRGNGVDFVFGLEVPNKNGSEPILLDYLQSKSFLKAHTACTFPPHAAPCFLKASDLQ
jgi:hypothetical protein